VHTVSAKQQLQKPTTERVLLADLHVEIWSLLYNTHPDVERSNFGDNYTYYKQIFTVAVKYSLQISRVLLYRKMAIFNGFN